MKNLTVKMIRAAEKYLNKFKHPESKPQTLWLAFLNGNLWTWGRAREDLKLGNLSEKDPRIEIKRFEEIA